MYHPHSANIFLQRKNSWILETLKAMWASSKELNVAMLVYKQSWIIRKQMDVTMYQQNFSYRNQREANWHMSAICKPLSPKYPTKIAVLVISEDLAEGSKEALWKIEPGSLESRRQSAAWPMLYLDESKRLLEIWRWFVIASCTCFVISGNFWKWLEWGQSKK